MQKVSINVRSIINWTIATDYGHLIHARRQTLTEAVNIYSTMLNGSVKKRYALQMVPTLCAQR